MMRLFQILGSLALLFVVGCQSSRIAPAQQSDTAKASAAQVKPVGAFTKIEGAWVVERITSAGRIVPKEKMTHEFHFKPPNQLIQKGIAVGGVTGRDREDEIALDDSKSPATMNMTRTVRGQPQTVFAIYKVEGELLTICFLRGEGRQPSTERPKVFESSELIKSDLLVLRRKARANQ